MAVKIRLKRMGKIRAPYYRIVVADSRKKRDGRVIEEIGKYHPKEEPSVIEVKSERAQYWLGVGAQPSEAVAAILKITGDWQTFKGEPGTEGTLRVAEPKRAKTDLFNEALKESSKHSQAEAVTKKAPKKAEPAPAAKQTPADEVKPDEVKKPDADKADKAKPEAEAPAVQTEVAQTEIAQTEVAEPEVAETEAVDVDKPDSSKA